MELSPKMVQQWAHFQKQIENFDQLETDVINAISPGKWLDGDRARVYEIFNQFRQQNFELFSFPGNEEEGKQVDNLRKKIAELDSCIEYAKKHVRDPEWSWAWKEQVIAYRLERSNLVVKLVLAEQETQP